MNKVQTSKKSVLKRPKYLNDADLTYELIISSGQGKLTEKCKLMLVMISNEMIKKFNYTDKDLEYDCKMFGLICMFENWHHFNFERYEKSFPYMSEIFKRGVARGLIYNSNSVKGIDAKKIYSVNNLLNI